MTYRLSAKFYDLFGSKNDLKFYRDLALRSGKRALELGVGTARVAVHLAETGISVVGIDNSAYMLQIAKQKLDEKPENVRNCLVLVKADMKKFDLAQSFPFIYIPASTFDHNITVEDRRRTLSRVYKHLEKHGTFAFDLEQITPGKPDTSWWIDRKEISDGSMVVRSVFTKRNPAERICDLDLFFDVYRNGKLVERYHEYGRVAIISKEEITTMLKENGFMIDAIYGDFDKSEYRPNSPRIVLVARKN